MIDIPLWLIAACTLAGILLAGPPVVRMNNPKPWTEEDELDWRENNP